MTAANRNIEDLPVLSELDADDFGRDLSWVVEDLYQREYVGPYQTSWGTPVFFSNEDVRAIGSVKESTHQTLESMSEYWRETAPEECGGLLHVFDEATFSKRAPEHLPAKKLSSRRMTSGSVSRFQETASMAIREQIEVVGDGTEIDFLHDFAKPMVSRFWRNVLGLTDEESALAIEFITDFQLSSLLEPTAEQIAQASRASEAYLDLMTEVLDREARTGRHDILIELSRDFEEMGPVGKPGSASTAFAAALLDGFHTFAAINANVTHALLSSPESLTRVRKDRELVEDAFLEGVRLHPAVILSQREALTDFQYKGISLREGVPLMACWMFGNLDPEVWPAPLDYRLDRNDRHKQTAFGGGAYVCAGRNLVRLVVEQTLTELTADDVDIQATGDVDWVPRSSIHELTRMPVAIRLR